MKNWIINQMHVICRDSIFRRLHEAGGCDAEDDYSRGYDDAITLALNILLEETGYDIEDVIG